LPLRYNFLSIKNKGRNTVISVLIIKWVAKNDQYRRDGKGCSKITAVSIVGGNA
jgi:hypothetical protein